MRRHALGLWLLTVVAAVSAGAAESEPAGGVAVGNAELARRVAAYVQPLADAGQVSGTLLVAREGTLVYEQSFGMADYELGVPNSPATRYCVASVTKPMTQIVAIRLLEQQKLALGDTLAKWIPDFPRGGEITVENLFRHRAGLPHRVTTDAEEIVPHTAAEMVEFAKRAPLLYEPGSQSVYSSAGYSVLARVLELAGGKPFEQLLEEHVLAPAGAVHSGSALPHRLIPGRSKGYLWGLDGPMHAPLRDLSFLVGAGSVFSTPRDLFAVMQALLTGAFGESARRSLVDEKGLDWNGITGGYRAFADYHAASKVTVIFTGNLFVGAADLLRRDLPKLAAGEALPPAQAPRVVPFAVPAALRVRYEGRYELRPGVVEELRFVGSEGTGAWIGDWFLIATGEDTFFSPQDYGTVKMVTGEDGTAQALGWSGPGFDLRFPRVGR
jgi:CubicO group peptidase (beta-lactamase class C family)